MAGGLLVLLRTLARFFGVRQLSAFSYLRGQATSTLAEFSRRLKVATTRLKSFTLRLVLPIR